MFLAHNGVFIAFLPSYLLNHSEDSPLGSSVSVARTTLPALIRDLLMALNVPLASARAPVSSTRAASVTGSTEFSVVRIQEISPCNRVIERLIKCHTGDQRMDDLSSNESPC